MSTIAICVGVGDDYDDATTITDEMASVIGLLFCIEKKGVETCGAPGAICAHCALYSCTRSEALDKLKKFVTEQEEKTI